jgi:hypothetical protein
MKSANLLLVLCAFLVCVFAIEAGALTGDNCDDPFEIHTLPFEDSGDTTGFSDDFFSGDEGAPDVVYLFAPKNNMTIYVSLQTSFNPVLYVFANDCSGSPIEYLEGNSGFSLDLEAHTSYFFVVDGYSQDDWGNFNLSIEFANNCPEPLAHLDDLELFYPTGSIIDLRGSAFGGPWFNQYGLWYTGANMHNALTIGYSFNEVYDDTLMSWDTTGLEPGPYSIQLFVWNLCGEEWLGTDYRVSLNLGFPGDLNRDNNVNLSDFVMFAENWLSQAAEN